MLKQFFVQFKALAWKNAVLKWRYVFVLLLEIAIPTLILLGLGVIKNAVKPSFIDVNIPTQMYPADSLQNMYVNAGQDCSGENLVWRYVNVYIIHPFIQPFLYLIFAFNLLVLHYLFYILRQVV